MAIITAPDEIAKLRASGRIAAQALRAVVAAVKPGVTTAELNELAESTIIKQGGSPSFKGFEGYPAVLCTSINDEVVHGLPSADRKLQTGDIIGLDIGVIYQGLYSDHAMTVPVGAVSADKKRLLADTSAALQRGVAAALPGRHIGAISAAIFNFLQPRGYGIVRQLTGHGLGYAVHEPPPVPNFGSATAGPLIEPGLVLAIEPMVNLGRAEVETQADGWTVVTADHQPSAHFEHTVLVTATGAEIITGP